MEVILLQRVPKLGQMGETVKVKDGFARNFLLPSGKALRATKANKERFDTERVQLEAHNLEAKKDGDGRRQAQRQSFVLIRQAGESGQLYGSVSARDIGEAATSGGYTIESLAGRPRHADQDARPARRDGPAPSRGRGQGGGQRRPLPRRGGAPGARGERLELPRRGRGRPVREPGGRRDPRRPRNGRAARRL